MFAEILRVGTRTSPLALRQVGEVLVALRTVYPQAKFQIKGIETYGDRDKITPISDIEGTDFFTREIEEKLLKGEIDFAVHSAKDLPDEIPAGLTIAAITKSIDPYDALVLRLRLAPTLSAVKESVSQNNSKIDELRKGARIGASSWRRKSQLQKYRQDFQIIDIRGNIEERLAKLEQDGLDAIIVAACALVRLGLEDRIAQRIPLEILKPHPLQGALAIEVREDREDLITALRMLNEG